MIILGIETTCDETGVGIVRDGKTILSNIVASSVSMHKKFGGIVPEVAAREQVKVIIPSLSQALNEARLKIPDIDAVAVANGPGLVGSLLIGVETAKTLALVFRKPLILVNHLTAHIYANWIQRISNFKLASFSDENQISNLPRFPLIALIVSGGHTDLILMTDHGKYRWLGGTLDDACGEAFDKVARVLGLSYPGGPEIEKVAKQLTTDSKQLTHKFPRPMIDSNNFDFSFAGLKTAVVNLVHSSPSFTKVSEGKRFREEIAFEFQNAVVDVLVKKTIKAARKFDAKSIVVGGGVAANGFLRSQFTVHSSQLGIDVFFPPKNLSVDNGVMIAAAAFFIKKFASPLKVAANPGLYF